ncbi:MAG: VCBS repeat-containing protein [Acidobacteriota bacterium]
MNSRTLLLASLLAAGTASLRAAEVYTARTIRVGNGPMAVSLADLDGDGRGDLAVATIGDSRLVVRADSPGSRISLETSKGPYSILAHDLNADGQVDLLITCYFEDRPQVAWRQGSRFQLGSLPKVKEGPVAAEIVELNGDGLPDIITANLISGTLGFFEQQKKLRFRLIRNMPVSGRPTALRAADFNGDKRLDIAVACSQTDLVHVFVASKDGVFGNPLSIAAGMRPASLAIADFNGDSLPDIAIAHNSSGGGTLLLSRRDSPGTFQPSRSLILPAAANSVASADLDGDHRQDLVFTQPAINKVVLLKGKGDGSFELPVTIGVGKNPSAVAVGDLNGDKKPDIATANFSDETVTVLVRN